VLSNTNITRLRVLIDYALKNSLILPRSLSKSRVWHLIWKLQTLPKVKFLIWRVCRIWLPTRIKLRDRGVNCPTHCIFCNVENEDSLHIFFLCRNSRSIWRHNSFSADVSAALSQDSGTQWGIHGAKKNNFFHIGKILIYP
jgi:hypothetical protein